MCMCVDELSTCSKQLDESRSRASELQGEVDKLQHDLNEAKSAAMVTMCNMENKVEIERRTCSEEVATLQQLLQEQSGEASETLKHQEMEIRRLKKENDRLDSELLAMKDDSNILSSVSRTLVKRVGNISGQQDKIAEDKENMECIMKKVSRKYVCKI